MPERQAQACCIFPPKPVRTIGALHPEPVTRLSSLRKRACASVDDFGGGPAPDFDEEISERWESAGEAAKRCFDRRSAELVAAATAGLETVSFQREKGLDDQRRGARVIADELRSGLKDLERIFGPLASAGPLPSCDLAFLGIGAPFAPASVVQPSLVIAEQMRCEQQELLAVTPDPQLATKGLNGSARPLRTDAAVRRAT
jgi:hypothetical protein